MFCAVVLTRRPKMIAGIAFALRLLCAGSPCSAQEERAGIWISPAEVRALPMEGTAWSSVLAAADEPLPVPDLGARDGTSDVRVMARALVFVRTGETRYREEVLEGLRRVMGTEKNGDVLALARNLPGFVIAADLVRADLVQREPELERAFRGWLRGLLDAELDGKTLRRIHEKRPNNWGLHAGGARVVIARYLEDEDELARVAQVLRGWLGERSAYDGFDFGDLDWQADAAHPVGVNPRGAQRAGHSIDGVLPDDQRRAGGFTWPPPKENYVYEALQGALLQAVVLARAGHDVWDWGDRALLRAFQWLESEAHFPAVGDDTWQPHVINHFYGTDLPAITPARPGKNVGWTDWTLAGPRARAK